MTGTSTKYRRGAPSSSAPPPSIVGVLPPAEQYVSDILDGTILSCRWVRLACQRHRDDLVNGHLRGLYFDEVAANHVIGFFDFLRHSKGEWSGQSFALEPWEQFVLWSLFGWKRGDGFRRFRTAYLEISRKNGKSTMLSGIGLYLFAADKEPGAEVYCLDPMTRVLCGDLQWRPVGELCEGDKVVGFDEEPEKRKFRKLRMAATVTHVGRVRLPSSRIKFTDGREVIASNQHMWLSRSLCGSNQRWRRTDKLVPGARVRSLGEPWDFDNSREAGYLAGIFDGEGFLGDYFTVGFCQKPGPILDKVRSTVEKRGFHITSTLIHETGTGYFNISGVYDVLRFLGQIGPERLLRDSKRFEGQAPTTMARYDKCRVGWAYVESVESLGEWEVVAIETTTHTLFAEGLFSHNTAATKRDQALLTHAEATRMVRSSPDLKSRISIYKNNLSIDALASKFEPLGKDADSCDGLNIHGGLIDELHAHKTRDMWDVLETATGSRRQPLQIAITTAGFNRETICWEQHEYTEKILKGSSHDDTYFGIIYTIDDDDDWKDEKIWIKANPNLGVSVKIDDLQRKALKAKEMPSALNNFLRKHLDVWVQQSVRAIDMDLWNANYKYDIEEDSFRGQLCFGGLDLSSVSDLTAWVMVFPDLALPERIDLVCRFWCPESRLTDRKNRYRHDYEAWHRDGFLMVTPGDAIDYNYVRDHVLSDAKKFQLDSMNVDRLFQGYQLAMELADKLNSGGRERVGTMGMGFMSMVGPVLEFEKRLLNRNINHGNNPVMKWMADNLALREDPAGNRKPDKAASQGKIDGIVALLMALDRAMRQAVGKSVYETRGLASV